MAPAARADSSLSSIPVSRALLLQTCATCRDDFATNTEERTCPKCIARAELTLTTPQR